MSSIRNYLQPAFLPKPLGDWQRIDVDALPRRHFIAGLMQVPMVAAAERYGELIADFETQGPGLGKPQVMRIGRLAPANQAGSIQPRLLGAELDPAP